MTIHPALDSGIKLGFAESYLEALALVERLHRLLWMLSRTSLSASMY